LHHFFFFVTKLRPITLIITLIGGFINVKLLIMAGECKRPESPFCEDVAILCSVRVIPGRPLVVLNCSCPGNIQNVGPCWWGFIGVLAGSDCLCWQLHSWHFKRVLSLAAELLPPFASYATSLQDDLAAILPCHLFTHVTEM
jgi:hypothetical protein